MSFALRYRVTGRHIALLAASVCILFCLLLAFAYSRAPSVPDSRGQRPENSSASWQSTPDLTKSDWSPFRRLKGSGAAAQKLAKRFRLAGTFFIHGPRETMIQKAIVTNLRTKDQHLVVERDQIEDVQVVSIFLDRIVLRAGVQEETLWLSHTPEQEGLSPTGKGGTDWLNLPEGDKIISTNEYGALVGENEWVMNRQKLVGYCNELQDHPARLEKLFDSMKPVYVYDNARKRRIIQGYRLHVEGESDFFKAVGLKPGDVVRRVNKMDMSGKHRAMFWIDMFLKDKANAFTLDVDRGGKSTQIKYLVR